MCAERIVPDKLRFDINARQAKFVHRQDGDLLFRQLIKQCDRCKWMPGLLHRLVEYRAVFSRQVQQVDDFVQLLIDVGCTLTSDGQVVAGTVVGEQYAVAVVDQSPRRRYRQDMDTVVFGDGRVVIEFHDLENVQAHHQSAADGEHEQSTGNQAFVDQPRLFFMVLDRDWFRHFYSNSLT